jgi:hypothetical protein
LAFFQNDPPVIPPRTEQTPGMTRFFRTFSLVWLIGTGVHAAPHHTISMPVVLPDAPPPITVKCPCDLHVQDGMIEISGAGQIVVGPRTTDYTGGHWSSDAAVAIDNHAPEPKKSER